jgi:prolyl oligopeptidase
MRICLVLFLCGGTLSLLAQALHYPLSKKGNASDTYHGITVPDSYRWLENDTAAETRSWIRSQNALTFDYLGKIPFREELKSRITELNNYEKWWVPLRAGDYYFSWGNSGLQNQAVLYVKKGIAGKHQVFIDPNTLSQQGTVSVGIAGISKDKKHLAYSLSKAGSDWSEIRIREVSTGKELDDRIEWVKFSAAAWDGKGFYYSRYPKPESGSELSGQNRCHAVYYHRLGDTQDNDKLIYDDKAHPLRYHSLSTTRDGRFLLLSISEGTDGHETWYRDTRSSEKSFKPLFTGFRNKSTVIDNEDGHLLVLTDEDAPHYRIVKVDPKRPGKENWQEIVSENDDILQHVEASAGSLFLNYLQHACSRVVQLTRTGKLIREVQLPDMGSVEGFAGEKEDTVLYYSFSSFNRPATLYAYHLKSGHSEVFRKPELRFDPDQFVIRREFVSQPDGVKIPLFIVHRKGLLLNGENPALLYAYGGFNISLRPQFNPSLISFLEKGGVYAQACIRGGGEYGRAWHEAGMLEKKQQVFNDFIACAEFLHAARYTSPSRLAIQGRSNGGLLIGAVMTQRPDLFKVAIPQVGVMDMLRFQKFTVGWGWVSEYGSSDDPKQFRYLLDYSPLHNATPAPYPATLVTTSDHDDRVVPAHSYKFTANLQAQQTGDQPVLIRIETDAGHGAGTALSKSIALSADIYSFILHQTESALKDDDR